MPDNFAPSTRRPPKRGPATKRKANAKLRRAEVEARAEARRQKARLAAEE